MTKSPLRNGEVILEVLRILNFSGKLCIKKRRTSACVLPPSSSPIPDKQLRERVPTGLSGSSPSSSVLGLPLWGWHIVPPLM